MMKKILYVLVMLIILNAAMSMNIYGKAPLTDPYIATYEKFEDIYEYESLLDLYESEGYFKQEQLDEYREAFQNILDSNFFPTTYTGASAEEAHYNLLGSINENYSGHIEYRINMFFAINVYHLREGEAKNVLLENGILEYLWYICPFKEVAPTASSSGCSGSEQSPEPLKYEEWLKTKVTKTVLIGDTEYLAVYSSYDVNAIHFQYDDLMVSILLLGTNDNISSIDDLLSSISFGNTVQEQEDF